ncbi:hypothetical protein Hypma_004000 [Hypsizygus marmoreus]|uniref:Uncharacterized protein n=1 Tax=Hypsizygus marmoreus TaxID=39966 RepID=A0A369J0Y4_HYPMA|nr:hypothetical protein Hypma_004000 [Hypsizygus marmoreus]
MPARMVEESASHSHTGKVAFATSAGRRPSLAVNDTQSMVTGGGAVRSRGDHQTNGHDLQARRFRRAWRETATVSEGQLAACPLLVAHTLRVAFATSRRRWPHWSSPTLTICYPTSYRRIYDYPIASDTAEHCGHSNSAARYLTPDRRTPIAHAHGRAIPTLTYAAKGLRSICFIVSHVSSRYDAQGYSASFDLACSGCVEGNRLPVRWLTRRLVDEGRTHRITPPPIKTTNEAAAKGGRSVSRRDGRRTKAATWMGETYGQEKDKRRKGPTLQRAIGPSALLYPTLSALRSRNGTGDVYLPIKPPPPGMLLPMTTWKRWVIPPIGGCVDPHPTDKAVKLTAILRGSYGRDTADNGVLVEHTRTAPSAVSPPLHNQVRDDLDKHLFTVWARAPSGSEMRKPREVSAAKEKTKTGM